MTLETETATRLRADATLAGLLPGGVYRDSDLGEEGITDPKTTPDVWSGGFQPTAIVHQRAKVPTGQLVDLKAQVSDAAQTVMVWVYALADADIELAIDRIYALLQGHRFTSSWPAVWTTTEGILNAPELPTGTKMAHIDFQVRSLRRAT